MNRKIILAFCFVIIGTLLIQGCANTGKKRFNKSERAQLYYETGIGYLGQGEPEKGIDALKTCLEIDPEHATGMHALGLCYLQMNLLDAAEMWLLKSLDRMPNDAELLNNITSLYLRQKRYQEAITQASKVLSNPDYVTPAAAYFNRGIAQFKLSRIKEAKNDFKMAVKHEPFFDRAHLMLGRVYLEEGNSEKAITFLSNCIKVNANNVEAFFHRGIAYWNRGFVTEAENDFNAILRKVPNDSSMAKSAKDWLDKLR